jgi:hypothetical protein
VLLHLFQVCLLEVQDDEDPHILLESASAQFITVCQRGCTALAPSAPGHPWPAWIRSRARHRGLANQVAAIVSPYRKSMAHLLRISKHVFVFSKLLCGKYREYIVLCISVPLKE